MRERNHEGEKFEKLEGLWMELWLSACDLGLLLVKFLKSNCSKKFKSEQRNLVLPLQKVNFEFTKI